MGGGGDVSDLPRSLFPQWYKSPLNALKYDEVIIVNWLQLEIEDRAWLRLPVLEQIKGHRNREVHDFVHGFYHDKLDELALAMYGAPYKEGRE
jgi:hypothetical protein